MSNGFKIEAVSERTPIIFRLSEQANEDVVTEIIIPLQRSTDHHLGALEGQVTVKLDLPEAIWLHDRLRDALSVMEIRQQSNDNAS